MQKKWIIVLCVTFGLLAGTFVFVEAKVFKKPVTMKKTLSVVKSLTIGTKNNLGKLFVKGEISNPVNGEKVVVNDDLSVKKNLDIYGNLRIFGNYEKVTIINTKDLADESVTTSKLAKQAVTTAKLDGKAVTSDKIDAGAVTSGKIKAEAVGTDKIADGTITNSNINFSTNGFIKAGGYVAADGTGSDLFNNLTGSTEGMSAGKISTGYYGVTIPNLTTHDHVMATAFMWGVNRGTVASLFSISTGGFVVYMSEPAGGSPQDAAFYFMVF